MNNIGVIVPYSGKDNPVSVFINKFKRNVIPIEEYGFDFIVADDRQNCSKIFNKNNVDSIVILTDCEISSCNFKIIDGGSVYKKMIPEFVRKVLKSKGHNTSVTVVDKKMSADGENITDELCRVCSYVYIVTENTDKAEKISENMMYKYGAVVGVCSPDSLVRTDAAVVLDMCRNKFDDNCIIIDKNRRSGKGVVNDFYIPFKAKPPLGMSNIVFGECLEINNIDI